MSRAPRPLLAAVIAAATILSSPGPGRAQPATPADLNVAGLQIDMLPGPAVVAGGDFRFRVLTRRPGYLVLVDVNAEGVVTQLYPNIFSMKLVGQVSPSRADPCLSPSANTLSSFGLAGGGDVKSNYIEPGMPFELPGTRSGTGYAFQACPPRGRGMVMAILSNRPVQIVDLPDIPATMVGEKAGFDQIVSGLRSLRLVSSDQSDQTTGPRWSVTAAPYTIQ